MGIYSLLAMASTGTASTTGGTDNTMALLMQIGMFALIIVVFYFLLIRPQRKRDKETQAMRSSIEVGDRITTIGGVVGRVVSVKDDTITIESGADKVKITFLKTAVQNREKQISD